MQRRHSVGHSYETLYAFQSLPKESQNTDDLLRRLKDERFEGLLSGAFRTLTRDYSDFKRIERILETIESYYEAFHKYENGDSSPLDQIGGIRGFKDKVAGWLRDEDQAIRAFAATGLDCLLALIPGATPCAIESRPFRAFASTLTSNSR